MLTSAPWGPVMRALLPLRGSQHFAALKHSAWPPKNTHAYEEIAAVMTQFLIFSLRALGLLCFCRTFSSSFSALSVLVFRWDARGRGHAEAHQSSTGAVRGVETCSRDHKVCLYAFALLFCTTHALLLAAESTWMARYSLMRTSISCASLPGPPFRSKVHVRLA